MNRIHAALHPNCYQRLVKALGFRLPDQRLEVPQFFLSSNHSDRNEGHSDRGPILELGTEDLKSIKDNLGELAERRRRASTGLLRIMADGVLCKTLDLERARSVRLDLDREPELIEIWTTDETGDLLLASHLMTYRQPDAAEPLHASIFFDDGQQVSIVLSSSIDVSGAVVEVSYEGTSPNQATVFRPHLGVLSAGHRLFARYQSAFSGSGNSKFLIPALTLLLLFILTGGIARYIQRTQPLKAPQEANNGQTQSSPTAAERVPDRLAVDPNTKPAAIASQKNPVDKHPAFKETQPAPPVIRKPAGSFNRPSQSLAQAQRPDLPEQQITANEDASSSREVTRGATPGDAAVSLVDVKRVYVESGEEPSSQILRQVLIRQLQLSERFTLSKTRDEADAMFKVTTRLIRPYAGKPRKTESLSVVVLVNARGDVIWPVKIRSSRGRYVGLSPEQVSAQVMKDLGKDIEHLRRQR